LVGDKPFVRATFIYVEAFGCQKQEGKYTFTSVREEEYNGSVVTVGEAKFTFNGLPRGSWRSYIKKGEGQVFAESPEKRTRYKSNVLLIPYEASGSESSTPAARVP
jgi:hypothetical protein